MPNRNLIHKLFELGAVKFGSFALKSGIRSPIYVDLRLTVSSPKLLVAIGEALRDAVRMRPFDLVVGVPYTALPFATAISIQHNIPMLLRRKEKKDYGTGKILEGIFSKGQTCLVIEDVITSGQSILETIEVLEAEGLAVKDVAVLVDREQGGVKRCAERGYAVHPVCTLTDIVNTLLSEKKINSATAAETLEFIRTTQV